MRYSEKSKNTQGGDLMLQLLILSRRNQSSGERIVTWFFARNLLIDSKQNVITLPKIESN